MVCLRMITWAQFCRLIPTGATKSFSCEVNESDDRLLSIAVPNDAHLLGWKMRRRSICASPNVRASFEPVVISPSDSAAGIGEELIVPVAHGLPPQVGEFTSRSWAGPQAVPVHLRAVMSAR